MFVPRPDADGWTRSTVVGCSIRNVERGLSDVGGLAAGSCRRAAGRQVLDDNCNNNNDRTVALLLQVVHLEAALVSAGCGRRLVIDK